LFVFADAGNDTQAGHHNSFQGSIPQKFSVDVNKPTRKSAAE
jgi:hypothetical protein